MAPLEVYRSPDLLPAGDAARIARLLGVESDAPLSDVELAIRIAGGLKPASVTALSEAIGRENIVGPVITEPTLRRARKAKKALSKEMSERLYELGRVIDMAGRLYHGDTAAISRFLTRPHALLGGQTPLALAQSSSAGAEAVINMMRRAEAGIAA